MEEKRMYHVKIKNGLTTRADDNHAPPVTDAPKGSSHYGTVIGMSRFGKVLRVASN